MDYQTSLDSCAAKKSAYAALATEKAALSRKLQDDETELNTSYALLKREVNYKTQLNRKIAILQARQAELTEEVAQYESLKGKREAEAMRRSGNILGALGLSFADDGGSEGRNKRKK